MIIFFRKIVNYGFKRLFTFIFVRQYLFVKKCFYYFIFSDGKPCFYFRSILQPTQFVGKGKIVIGATSQLGVWPSPNLLSGYSYLEARGKDSLIKIGEKTFINNSAVIIADKTSISIGDNCLVGPNVNIFDSDFHGLELENRNNGAYECIPVNIGNNVFIGANVTILKGVSIGEGSVVANGSVVIKDVEAFSIVAGVPANKVRSLNMKI